MKKQLQILLADDDVDDCMFFKESLEALQYSSKLTIFHNGGLLMEYLNHNRQSNPDVLFLDLNMPLKNGLECLAEIKADEDLKHIRVVIFSTTAEQKIVNSLYSNGANYFIQKPTNFLKIRKVIDQALSIITHTEFEQPAIKDFLLTGDY